MRKAILAFYFVFFLPVIADAQLSGHYMIGLQAGSNYYPSFTDAVKALVQKGVSGPVVFTVADGIYDETITIPAIKGAGPEATITFQSVADQPRRCTLRASRITDSLHIGAVNLVGARYISFKGISIKNYQSPRAAAIHISAIGKESSAHIQFAHCHFFSDSTSGISSYTYNILISNTTVVEKTATVPLNHIVFNRCRFNGGTYGIAMAGETQTPLNTVQIDSCVFTNQNGFCILGINIANITLTRSTFHQMRPGFRDITAVALFDTWNCHVYANNIICPVAVAFWLTMDTIPPATNTSYIVDNYFLGGSAHNAVKPIGEFSNTKNIIFYHNTFKTSSANTHGPNFTGNVSDFSFINNVIEAGKLGEHCFAAPSKGFTGIIDNNIYYGSGKFYFGSWQKDFNTWRTNFPSLNAQSVYYSAENNNRMVTVIAVLLVIALAISSYKIYQHRKHLNAEKLITMQQEQQIIQLRAMMQGEEKERIRIAQELHDGIVSQLSAVKMNFNAVQHHHPALLLAGDFKDALQQLEDTTEDLRKTSQNMMPKILQQAGLEAAVHAFCEKIQKSTGLDIDFRVYGKIPRINVEFELSVYRIIQELLQNIVKHAHAAHVLVHLSCYENLLSITVEDDGIGMPEHTDIATGNGIGLNNIKDRLKVLNGRMDIQSSAGSGTAVYLEFAFAGND